MEYRPFIFLVVRVEGREIRERGLQAVFIQTCRSFREIRRAWAWGKA